MEESGETASLDTGLPPTRRRSSADRALASKHSPGEFCPGEIVLRAGEPTTNRGLRARGGVGGGGVGGGGQAGEGGADLEGSAGGRS